MVQGYQADIEPGPEETPPAGPAPPFPSLIGVAEPPPFIQPAYASWVRVAEDAVIATGPILLWGVIYASFAGADVVFFEGQNALGRRMFSLRPVAGATITLPVIFTRPLLCRNGLFVDVSADVDDLLVAFEPVREEHIPLIRYAP